MNRLRVLKLGWEFPPLINGGLGIACLGLSRALAKQVDLRVVVPKSAPEACFDGFTLTGLNHLTIQDLQTVEDRYRYESFAQVQQVPVQLDPYEDGLTTHATLETMPGGEVCFSATTLRQLEQFKIGELYGQDLGNKVIEFSKIAEKPSSRAATSAATFSP